MTQLHRKYRPQRFKDVAGHDSIVKALRASLGSQSSQAFLFVGDPGLGKTTLARLIARALGVDPDRDAGNYLEFDGATNTGVDDMRAILQTINLSPIGMKSERVLVIDECHMLSKSAWNSALKSVEEPPRGVFWVFCTTEVEKVPASIRSRCQVYHLNPVSSAEIGDLLDRVVSSESLDIPDETLKLIVDHADGSPRAALVALGQVQGVQSAMVPELLEGSTHADSAEAFEVAQLLMKGATFRALAAKVIACQGKTTAEGIRRIVCRYFTKVAAGPKWSHAASILLAFGTPYPPGIGNDLYPVLVSLAELFGED